MLQVEGDLVMLQVGGDLGYYNLRWFLFIAISSIVQIFPRVQASPISVCPRYEGSYFVSDSVNSCIYYWCVNGAPISPGIFHCAPGSGTKSGYHGIDNPCSERVASCQREEGGYYSRHPGYITKWKPWTTRPFITRPLVTKPLITKPLITRPPDGKEVSQKPRKPIQGKESDDSKTTIKSHGSKKKKPPIVITKKSSKTIVNRFLHIPIDLTASFLYVNNPQVVLAMPGFHVPGAIRQITSHGDLNNCLTSCLKTDDCRGIDFNRTDSSCWFHSQVTVCYPPVVLPGCVHLKLTPCDSPVSESTPNFIPFFEDTGKVKEHFVIPAEFNGVGIYGGAKQVVKDLIGCLSECASTENCVGVDFHNDTNDCYFFDDTEECQPFINMSSTTHFRLYPCSTDDNLSIAYPDTHAVGGSYQAGISAADDCLKACDGDSCVAVDFDKKSNTCWFHNNVTCAFMEDRPDTLHIRKSECL